MTIWSLSEFSVPVKTADDNAPSLTMVDFFFVRVRGCELDTSSSSEQLAALAVLEPFSALTVLQSLSSSVISGCLPFSRSGSEGLDADWVAVLQVISRLHSLISFFSNSSLPAAISTPTDSAVSPSRARVSNGVFGYRCNVLNVFCAETGLANVSDHKTYRTSAYKTLHKQKHFTEIANSHWCK